MIRLTLVALLFVVACNSADTPESNQANQQSAAGDSTKAIAETVLSGCYSWVVNKDSAAMRLDADGKEVTGELEYNWSEKDKNKGNLKGYLQDSLLSGYYTFGSEGMTSVREVAFKIKDNTLLEGFGDVINRGDTVVFKDKSQLQFQTDRFFIKGDCNGK